MTKQLSPEEQELLDFRENLRIRFENALLREDSTRKRGNFMKYARIFLSNQMVLMALPNADFLMSRSAAQQGFDRVFIGTNVGTPQYKPGLRPNSDYRVMVDEFGYFVLLDMHHPQAWEKWEQYCIDKHGASTHPTEYGSEITLNEQASEIDAETRDLEEVK